MDPWDQYISSQPMQQYNIQNKVEKKKKRKKGEVRAKVMKKQHKIKRLVRIKCPICFESKESMSTTFCGHVFCTSCIKKTVLLKHKCPICRKTLRGANAFHRLFLDDSNLCELINNNNNNSRVSE